MIKNVIFDLGGVVLGRSYEREGDALKSFRFLQGESFPDYWKDFDKGLMTQAEVARQISRDHGGTAAEAEDMVIRIMHMFDEFPETVRLVKELSAAGYKLYVLSNMPAEFYEHMRGMEVFGYFDGVVISSTEKMSKPDPDFFRLLLDRYGLTAEETLFVDDKVMNIDAARALGLHTCLFKASGSGPDDVREILKR